MKLRSFFTVRVLTISLLILVLLNLVFLGKMVVYPLLAQRVFPPVSAPEAQVQPAVSTVTQTQTTSPLPPKPTNTPAPLLIANAASAEEMLRTEGVLVLSIRDGNYSRLFAYHPLYLPLTRLTDNPWDDITPALSPDGLRLAYSSRQNGYWDLYVLDLTSGEQTRLTDTPAYEASPTWSPDGQWIAYERYDGDNLNIYIQSLTEPDAEPIQLTDDPGIDRAPAWSPQGREIAFVSSRTGDEEIWLARLDNVSGRFYNVSRNPLTQDQYPVWSEDGQRLAWSAERNGDHRLTVAESTKLDEPAALIGESSRAAWSTDGKIIYSEVLGPNQVGLAAYLPETGRISLPLTPLPGPISGMVWVRGPLFGWLADKIFHPDQDLAQPLWQPMLTKTVEPAGRMGLVPLTDVTAPQPLLHDAVDEAYNALRLQIAAECGWDALSSLENAYIALTTPPTPSMHNDWLYTGRGFALNPLLASAGWMTISREDFGGQTYWRVYLKARYQDGSMGMPLNKMVWDISARYSGDTRAYEEGGKLGQTPAGYWIDLTELAGRFGWERLPSLVNWRTFYPSIRSNQFVITGGLDWRQAMGELYPPEALITATSVPTVTRTPTATLRRPTWAVTATPTPTLTPTATATRRPTWTAAPTEAAP
jgi:TolB protein